MLGEFPSVLNFGLLDKRLIDLSMVFPDNPDFAITTAFPRLDDIVHREIVMSSRDAVFLYGSISRR